MIRYLIPLLVVQLVSLILLWLIFRKFISKKGNVYLKLLLIGFGLYLTIILILLLNPVYFYRRLQFSTSRINLVPFYALKVWKANPNSFFGSILLFIPLGFFVVLFRSGKTSWQKLFSAISTSILLSLTIEIAQMWTGRVSDIDDIILNTIGTLIGAVICLIQQKLGFDKTKIGKILLPKIPDKWDGCKYVQLYCNILGLLAFGSILIINYFVTLPSYNTYVYDGNTLKLEAHNVALLNESTGNIVFEVNADEKISSASTMKILAVLTAMDYVNENEEVTIGREIYAVSYDSSKAGFEYGMKVTVKDLLEGAMLPSGADAIYALGTYVGRKIAGDLSLSYKDAMKIFINTMNEKAQSIGAVNTNVVRADGYDADNQYTTANDLLIIAKEYLKNPLLTEICDLSSDEIVIDSSKVLTLTNTNQMIQKKSIYYNENITGLKTGTTAKAGNCLVSIFTIDNETYICVVMGSTYDGKFRDTQTLFEFTQKLKVA